MQQYQMVPVQMVPMTVVVGEDDLQMPMARSPMAPMPIMVDQLHQPMVPCQMMAAPYGAYQVFPTSPTGSVCMMPSSPAGSACGMTMLSSSAFDSPRSASSCASSPMSSQASSVTSTPQGVWTRRRSGVRQAARTDSPNSATRLLGNQKLCSSVLSTLDDPNHVEEVMKWVLADAKELSLDPKACRVVQRLFDVATTVLRDALFAALAPHSLELLDSPNGNHVLNKAIEVVPSTALGPVLDVVLAAGPGNIARHRFGCRVLERLIEHCPREDMAPITAALIGETLQLAEHGFGNFAIKSMVEHGSNDVRAEIMAQLLPTVPAMATTRSGSYIVQHALLYCDMEVQLAIAEMLIRSRQPSFLDLAVDRAGSFVVEELARLRGPGAAALVDEARDSLRAAPLAYRQKVLFQRVAAHFGVTDL